MEPCRTDSGMVTISGSGGGSAERNTLKFFFVVGEENTWSKNPSRPEIPYNQDYIRCKFCKKIHFPLAAQSNIAFLALSSCPYPIEILMNLPFVEETSNFSPILSTSFVGSTPGNNTKNIGVVEALSLKANSILKAGYSTYSSPITSCTYLLKAEVNLSGLKALKMSSFWKNEISFIDLGKSHYSAFSSLYHFFHWSMSDSRLEQRFSKESSCSSPLQAAQMGSVMKPLRESGMGVGWGSTFPRIRCSISWGVSLPSLSRILRVIMVIVTNLCLSNRPLLV